MVSGEAVVQAEFPETKLRGVSCFRSREPSGVAIIFWPLPRGAADFSLQLAFCDHRLHSSLVRRRTGISTVSAKNLRE